MPITAVNPIVYTSAGGDWIGEASVCPDPACGCRNLTVEFLRGSEHQRVVIDLGGPSVGCDGDDRFARQLGAEIDDAQLHRLGEEFQRLKDQLYRDTDLAAFRYDFPFQEIEDKGLMIGYNQVLPFHQQMIFGNGPRYIASDAYCVLPHCDCTSAYALFFEYDPNDTGPVSPLFEIDLNAQAGTSKVRSAARGLPRKLSRSILAKWLVNFDYPTLVQRRATLRALYKWNRDNFYMDLTPSAMD
jgi:hypothetical protein